MVCRLHVARRLDEPLREVERVLRPAWLRLH